MLSQEQINERIDFAYKDLKIPENAERIFCDDKNFFCKKNLFTLGLILSITS